MAITVTENLAAQQRDGRTKAIKFAWVSADGADLEQATTNWYVGKIHGVQIVPAGGAAAPSDNFDITIEDGNGGDVLLGACMNCDNTTNTYAGSASLAAVGSGTLTINVANTGSAGAGTGYLWLG